MPTLSHVIKSVGLVTIIAAIGKVLGFGRESIIAAYFGASSMADVFFVASLIPTILFTALGSGLQAGVIPIYLEKKADNPLKADEFISVLGSFFMLVAGVMTIACMIFIKPLVMLTAPGFSDSELALTESLTRIMLPSLLFFTLSYMATGVLNANKRFILPALTSTAQNTVIIAATVLFAAPFGIEGLAWGFVFGAASQFLIQYPSLKKYGIRPIVSFLPHKRQIVQTLFTFYPIIIAALAIQLNSIVDRIIATSLETGSVSALNYANRLLWLPLSIVLTPLITVLYPSIVERALIGYQSFLNLTLKGLKSLLFLAIPFMVVMLISGNSLITLAFQRGAFDASATEMTYRAFIFYSACLPFFALRDYLMNVFYALKKTKVAMYSCLIAVLLNVLLSWVLSRYLGVGGIALASGISMLLQSLYLFSYLWLKTERTDKAAFRDVFQESSKLAIIGTIIYGIALWIHPLTLTLPIIMELVLISLLVFGLYLALSILFKVSSLQAMKRIRSSK
ncbi:murein biosynthesis integral membrane protein MurJ [Peribacillus simplex]|uniref:Probable lipid II flippase MurJ n=1 Tax=Peribacillus simplex TaxID=1478 RepID=A0A8B5Y1T2_9BACI|nr:murein biosynthesis integral membrane protein MurJ [Peribacillus simplex]MED3909941.1 murein biosynthesis integral membrane protein MurJ [Peribacillus simplex]TVX81968.1 murein biosynthesis integral membrane protein MurJ [Peribacillus simplex]